MQIFISSSPAGVRKREFNILLGNAPIKFDLQLWITQIQAFSRGSASALPTTEYFRETPNRAFQRVHKLTGHFQHASLLNPSNTHL